MSFRVIIRVRVRVRVRVSISIRFVACVVTSGECCRMIVVILSNLRNGLIQTDQSQHISQLVSQITLSHSRISQITQSQAILQQRLHDSSMSHLHTVPQCDTD